jgi:hypothetical protein
MIYDEIPTRKLLDEIGKLHCMALDLFLCLLVSLIDVYMIGALMALK